MSKINTVDWVNITNHPSQSTKPRRIDVANDIIFKDDPMKKEITLVAVVRTYDDNTYVNELEAYREKFVLLGTHSASAEPRFLKDGVTKVYKYQIAEGSKMEWVGKGEYLPVYENSYIKIDGEKVLDDRFFDSQESMSEYERFNSLKNTQQSVADIIKKTIIDLNSVKRFG